MKKERVTLLSTRQTWISLQVIILFALEVVYGIIFWQYESGKDQATTEAIIATARDVSVFIVPTIVAIIGISELGGEIMIRFTHLMQKAVAQGIAQGKAEGKAEVYQAWHADWEKRKQTAKAKGIPFNEPPPPKPDGYPEE